jgi:hypothetical protein
MGSLRFADLQTRPTEVLDLTSLTLEECQQLVPPFEVAFQAHMARWRLDEQPRTARRYTTYTNCPLPTPEDRLLFILVYLKTYPLQVVQRRLFGMGQSKAHQWIHVLLVVLQATLRTLGMHAVFRVGSRQIVDFTPHRPFVMPATRRSASIKGLPRSRWISAFGKDDQLVEWFKPRTCPPWLSPDTLEALPPSLVVRELRYNVTQRGFRSRRITVVTTLIDAERYPCADLAALYQQRWEAETHLAQLKTTMKMDVLHCQTVLGVHKELLVFAILYNLVRLVIRQSARQQQVDVGRISFLDALRWLGAPDTGVPLALLLINPVRPHRVEPRVKKRRPKAFPCMSKPRHLLRQALIQHAFGA